MVGSGDVGEGGPGVGRERLRMGYCVRCGHGGFLCFTGVGF